MTRIESSTAEAAAPADRRRWLALYVLCIGFLMIVLDATVVNVALPAIQDDLGFSPSNLAWVVNAYLIAFAGLLLLTGRLGDMIGRRRMLLSGLVVFTLASLLCGLAQSQAMLIGARFLQGIGGAATSAVILGMIVTMFPEQREQAKAIGTYSFVAASGASIGLLAGGALTDLIDWHWIFFVNLPIGVATLALVPRLVADDEGIGFGERADVLGGALITAGLMLTVYTIVEAESHGWGSAHTLGFGAGSLALVGAFVARQATARNPLMPLRIFRVPNVAGANAVMGLVVAGLFATFFLGSLYLERVLGYSPIEIGLAFLPTALSIALFSLRGSTVAIERFGARTTMLGGLLIGTIGLGLLMRAPVDGSYAADLLGPYLLIGVGMGLTFPSLMGLAMSGATAEDSGLASGLINTMQQAGGALGLAVLATLAAERTDGVRADGASVATSLTEGYQLAYGLGAGILLLGLAIALATLRSRPREPAPQADVAPAEA